ncbi:hypothetical protein JCM11641_000019 [Rhodosporidiobolus odoratus]
MDALLPPSLFLPLPILVVLLLLSAGLYFLFLPTIYPRNLPPGPRASFFGWGNHRGLIPSERPWIRLDELGKVDYTIGLGKDANENGAVEGERERKGKGEGRGKGFYTIWTGRKPTIVVTSARVAAELLDKRSNIYSSRPRFVVAGELMTGGDALLFLPYSTLSTFPSHPFTFSLPSASLMLMPAPPRPRYRPPDAKWRNQRRLYHAALMEKRANDYHPVQEMEVKRLVYDLLQFRAQGGMGWEKCIERFSASVVVAIAYGRRVDDVNEGFVQSVIKRMEDIGKTNLPGKQSLDAYPFLQSLPEFLTPYKKTWKAFRAESHAFWMSLAETVKERMEEGRAPKSFTRDLYEGFEAAKIGWGEFGILTGGIFGAGVETTSGTLIAFVLAMVTHPRAQKKAQEELDRVVGRERSPNWTDDANLPYLRALVQEVLRWRPVAVLGGTPHASSQDDHYQGYFIPAGSTILCNTWSINRDPEYFKDPDEFRPERYLGVKKEGGEGEGEGERYPQKAGHSAFGWGRRICPGMHVAERSIWIAIAHMLHHFTLSTPAGSPVPDIFAFTDGFNSRAEPFPLEVRLRGGEEGRKLVEKEREEAWEGLQVYEV